MKSSADKTREARERLPLRRLMEQRGKGPSNGNWKAFPKCPYCGKDSAGVFSKRGDRERFKCHHVSCPSGTGGTGQSWDEAGFMAFELGVSREEGWKVWMQEAGCWEEAQGKAVPPSPQPSPPGEGEQPAVERDAPRAEVAVTEEKKVLEQGTGGENLETGNLKPESGKVGGGGGEKLETRKPETESENLMEVFWGRIALTDEDAKKLWEKRGLTPGTCEALGFRSSQRSNEKVLLEMGKEFGKERLVEAGLWVLGDKIEARPNVQYCGWGVKKTQNPKLKTGKEKGRREEEWGWTYPILIPYTDSNGRVIDVRVHKRTQKGQAPRLYVPRRISRNSNSALTPDPSPQGTAIPPSPLTPLPQERGTAGEGDRGPSCEFAVVCEGEFKAAAAWQIFGALGEGRVAVGSLPGISMRPLFVEVEDWLEDSGAKRVVVVYDNEVKDDPKLPGYKAEDWRRHDAETWSRYLAGELAREGYEARVGWLPDEWRDQNGKADWDGALALLLQVEQR